MSISAGPFDINWFYKNPKYHLQAVHDDIVGRTVKGDIVESSGNCSNIKFPEDLIQFKDKFMQNGDVAYIQKNLTYTHDIKVICLKDLGILERVGRVALGLLLTIITLFYALTSNTIRDLYNNKQTTVKVWFTKPIDQSNNLA